ncbi:MAG: hypothetical protein HY868_22355 [Chloroflexi bacterium]|nr:hypothetical protein [Chloroflexota bacterium]
MTKFIFLTAILFALALNLVAAVPAFACEPRSDTDPRCDMPRPKPRVVARVAPTPTPKPTPSNPNRGLAPGDALALDANKWYTVGANSYLWFMNDNGQSFYQTVILETKLSNGVNFAAFSQEQENGLNNSSPPKGRGTLAPADGKNPKYTWKGSHAQGRWYFLVTNYNPNPVEIKLSHDQQADDRQCRGFWEVDAYGNTIWWVDCGMYGLNK